MPMYGHRPENALKRAQEFLDVGKKEPALEVLYETIKNRRNRTWMKVHEEILKLYLKLCIDLRRGPLAKEGLYQYKAICQQVALNSFETIVKFYLEESDERAEDARKESEDTVKKMMVEIEDLDQMQTPESLLLSFVSGEGTQDRTDRALLTPWVKSLWEAYRNVLDLLRNNNKVEKLYHDTAQDAFQFCLKYSRRTEFRKLCDNLRMHLQHVVKHQGATNAINLNSPESLQMHVEARLMQLEAAISMELWQEAFKTIEDIHSLLNYSKKPPKPAVVANYYNKQSKVYLMAGDRLYHACACHQLFVLSREQKKNLSQEELQNLATKTVLATLHVPIPQAKSDIEHYLDDDATQEKRRRLASLLGLQVPPTRQSLMKDLSKYGMIQFAIPEVQELYHWLEEEFNPLQLCHHVNSLFDALREKEEYAVYVKPLEDVVVMRLIKQVAQVYESIELSRLEQMVPFTSGFRLERAIVHAGRNLNIQVRIDHITKCLHFGSDLSAAQKDRVTEGPQVQAMPSDVIRNQLIKMATALQQAADIIDPKAREEKHASELLGVVQVCRQTAKREHRSMLQRKEVIEKRKEYLEQLNTERERQEREAAEKEKQKALALELERLQREKDERELQRKKRELDEVTRKQTLEKIEQMKKTALGQKALADLKPEELEDLDPDSLLAKQVWQLEMEKKELQAKLTVQMKKVDHLERAKRTIEIPKLHEQYEQKLVNDETFHHEQETKRIATAKALRQNALDTQERLLRMSEEQALFLKDVKMSRKAAFEARMDGYKRWLAEQRAVRLEERRKERIEERRATYYREKEEERRRIKEEEERAAQEKEMQKKREEEEARSREQEERQRKLDAQLSMQQEREKEIEEKLRLQEQEDRRLEEKRRETTIREGAFRSRVDESNWRRQDDELPITGRKERDDRPPGRYVPSFRREVERESTRELEREQDSGRLDSWERGRGVPERDRDRGDRDRGLGDRPRRDLGYGERREGGGDYGERRDRRDLGYEREKRDRGYDRQDRREGDSGDRRGWDRSDRRHNLDREWDTRGERRDRGERDFDHLERRERFDRDLDRGDRRERGDQEFDRGERRERGDRDFDYGERRERSDRDFDRGERRRWGERDFDRSEKRDRGLDRGERRDRGEREWDRRGDRDRGPPSGRPRADDDWRRSAGDSSPSIRRSREDGSRSLRDDRPERRGPRDRSPGPRDVWPKAKPEKEVDEEGFEKVQRRK